LLQDQSSEIGWDLMQMGRAHSTSLKLYSVFLFIVWIVAFIKLIRIWRQAWPFRLSRQTDNPAYLKLLLGSSSGLLQWTLVTFLGWGIYMSTNLSEACVELSSRRVIGSGIILDLIQDYAGILAVTLVTALVLFLIRWYMLKRIERLGGHQLSPNRSRFAARSGCNTISARDE
jgi:hypothetical protein